MALKSTAEAQYNADELDAQIQELRRDISEIGKTLKALGAAKAQEYKATADDMANEAIGIGSRAYDAARAEAMSLEESFERQVREKPLQALAIAAGVGFLAALLTRRG